MTGPVPRCRPEPRERFDHPLVTALLYALLAVLVIFTVIIKHGAGESLFIDLGLCVLLAVWMLGILTLRPTWRQRLMPLLITGLLVTWAVLVFRDAWFGAFAPAAYVYTFRLLRWPWLLPGVGAVAIVAGTAQASTVDTSTVFGAVSYVAVLAVNAIPMCALTWLAWRDVQRTDERERNLAALGEANRRLETTLAENTGLHQQLLTQARQAGVHDERQRMAQEIHDTLAQGLIGIITQLQAAEHAGDDPVEWRRHISAATTLARDSLSEARRSVHALRPQPLQAARLSEALADVSARWSALHGTSVQVTTTGEARPMSPQAEFALLRTAQEALANVAKHAHATRVGVTLSYLDGEIALDVRDDGNGFDPDLPDQDTGGVAGESAAQGGFGLVAMRQRIEGLSGTLQVESEPGGGTAISACVPAAITGARA
jgi:signal transduction histidine kinase